MKNYGSRFWCLLLSCALLVCSLAGCGKATDVTQETNTAEMNTDAVEEQEAAAETNADGLPAVGDECAGFVVKEIVPMDAIGATGVLYEHVKSGAELIYLASEDTNRSFDISFRTPALDDKGKPHVFEHITISGSQKYPDANMALPFGNQTYNTFTNAITYHGMTSYPLASLSEEQLMTMMDYYLSGVFEPLLYTEPKLVQREAWRYELLNAEDDLNIAGTVYSEMQGAQSISEQAMDNNMKTLYEGSTTAYVSGGVPDAIRTLTYEELVDFHDTYYHPSNALITLYGALDIKRFLEYIDSEYLCNYTKKEIAVDTGKIEPYTETKYAEYKVPVEAGTNTENASVIYYSFAMNDTDLSDCIRMIILSNVVLQESSPVIQALREVLPEAQIGGNMLIDNPSAPCFSITAEGVNPEDRDIFVEAVNQGLKSLLDAGLSEEALDSVLKKCKLELMTAQEDTDLGVNAGQNIAISWAYFGDVSFYAAYEDAVQNLNKETVTALLKRYLTDNAHRAVSVTSPAAGLSEENAAMLAGELTEKKASLSDKEIEELVTSSNEFIDWSNTPASAEIISQIANVEVEDLPEELRHYEILDETKDEVRYLRAMADVNDVCQSKILLDGSTIPIDKLRDVQICMQLMGELDTKEHSKEELAMEMMRYLSGYSATLTGSAGYQGTGYYAAGISWTGLEEDAKPAAELLSELLFDTDFSDTKTIKSLLSRWNTSFVDALDSNAMNIQASRCGAMLNDYVAYNEYVNNYSIFEYGRELAALADSDPEELTRRMEEARKLLLNRADATVLLAGDEAAVSAYQEEIAGILNKLPVTEEEKVDYSSLRIPKQNEGLVNNSTVQTNMLYGIYDGYSGKDIVMSKLNMDMYLMPQLRNGLGAYGAYSQRGVFAELLYTYRDPNLQRSYEIMSELPEYLRTADLTQEQVDSYILGSYSTLSRPEGVLSGAMSAMKDLLLNKSEELRLQWMKDAKATTVEDVRRSADAWDELLQNGVRSSSGSESTLKLAGDLFDVLIYPDGTIK